MQSIKRVFKKSKKIMIKYYSLLEIHEIASIFVFDMINYIKYSARFSNKGNKKIEQDILVMSHVIEKGLSHKELKPEFGRQFVHQLSERVKEYSLAEKQDAYILNLGIQALMEYLSANRKIGIDVSGYCYWPDQNPYYEIHVGVMELSVEELFASSDKDFASFASSRHSIRLYDSNGIGLTEDEINKCVQLANTAPSACNRQSSRVHVVFDRNMINAIATLQGGNKGFGEKSDTLIIVTTDVGLYSSTDRKLPLFDCGMYSMNLLYSLHYNGICACIMNGSLSISKERAIRNLLKLPNNETLGTIIAASKTDPLTEIRIAKAQRRKSEEILHFYGQSSSAETRKGEL